MRRPRHSLFGVLAPNSALRTAVTAIALADAMTHRWQLIRSPPTEPDYRRAARCAWARLLARIYFPLLCPHNAMPVV